MVAYEINDLIDDYVINDSEQLVRFEINAKHVYGKYEGENFTVISEEENPITKDVTVSIKALVNHEILEEILEEDSINLKQLVDPDLIQECVGEILVKIGNMLMESNHGFLNNNVVECLQKDLSVRMYNKLKTAGAMDIRRVRLDVVSRHIKYLEEEYFRLQIMEAVGLMLLGYEYRVLRHAAAMEMEQLVLFGALRASIDCEEVTCCSICYEEFMMEDEIRKMPCSSAHIFHPECIEKWLKLNHTCPLCRYQIPTVPDSLYIR